MGASEVKLDPGYQVNVVVAFTSLPEWTVGRAADIE
jgi:hypothetical protein